MLKFFKNLFGSGQAQENANGNGYAAQAYAPVEEASEPMTAQEAPETVSSHGYEGVASGNGLRVPLHAIIAVLPLELKTRIKQSMVAGMFITLSAGKVLAQLASGSVRLSFGELRAMVPTVFSPQNDRDSVMIPMPLNEILPQINPALLPRRQTQRHVEVPEEVKGPFGNECFGVTFADTRTITGTNTNTMTPQPPAAPAPAAPIAPRPMLPVKPAAPAPPVTPAKPTMVPQHLDPQEPVVFRRSIASTPTPPPPTATPSGSPPARPVFPAARGVGATPSPTPTPIPAPRLPGNGNGNGNGHGHAAPPVPATPSAAEVCLAAPLKDLIEAWPDTVRQEIVELRLTEAQLALPVRVVEPALRQGRVAFPWKVLRSWIRPATLPTVSAHDGLVLELPLSVLAPLFFARQKQNGPGRNKVEVDENIPNLFFGFPQGESAVPIPVPEPPPSMAPAPAPVALPPAAAAPVQHAVSEIFVPSAKQVSPSDTNFYVWGDSADTPRVDETEFKRKPGTPGTDFLSRHATPNEVVARASALEGVVGALVALPDGLMVASKISTDVNADTLAAFLPHIFGKVSQCTKELRMGELNNLHFTVGNVPWKIFRVNAIFFAAFGRAGQPLPTGQLATLAALLDRKKQ